MNDKNFKMPEDIPANVIFSPLRGLTDHLSIKIDRLFRAEMWFLHLLAPRILQTLGTAATREDIEAHREIATLLLNANTTTMAALELWRRGFPLQVGMLLRNALETVATAAAILCDGEAYQKFKAGTFESPKAFTIVKRVWPMIGAQLARANGDLSRNFTHVGPLYNQWQSVSAEIGESDVVALQAMLIPLKVTFHVLDLLGELVCYNAVETPRYWAKQGAGQYLYRPTSEGEAWMREFLSEHELNRAATPEEDSPQPKTDG
jgi:hypothetical protein